MRTSFHHCLIPLQHSKSNDTERRNQCYCSPASLSSQGGREPNITWEQTMGAQKRNRQKIFKEQWNIAHNWDFFPSNSRITSKKETKISVFLSPHFWWLFNVLDVIRRLRLAIKTFERLLCKFWGIEYWVQIESAIIIPHKNHEFVCSSSLSGT